MKKIIAITLIIPFLLVLFTLSSSSNNENRKLGDIFEELGVSMKGVGNFVVYKDILREGLKNTFWTIMAKKNGRVIKIEVIKNIGDEDANRYIKERQYVIESLYRHIPSPYPGMISNTIECPDEFKPEVVSLKIQGETTPVYILYSTSRFTYGAGVEELIKYRGALVFIYSGKMKALYRIELFIPKEEFNKKEVLNILESIRLLKTSKASAKKFIDVRKDKPVKLRKKADDFEDYNLIIIGFDPLGAKHMSAYGYFRKTTPNIDKFSKDVVLFKNAVSPSSWTLPVFMSWFTSLYPSQHKIVNKYVSFKKGEEVFSNLSELSPSVVTLAQVLKKSGYATAGFTGDAGVGGMFGYDLGFDVYYDKTTFGGFDTVLPMALDWLEKHKNEKFFLFIQAYDVHGRYQHSENFRSKFLAPNYRGKYKGTSEEYWELRNLSLDEEFIDMADDDVEFWRSWYDGKIFEADKKLGEFLKELKKLGIMDKTIMVISSASGNEFYEHGRFDHGYSLYDELIYVPLLIKIPENKGKIVESQVRTIDIMPTVLELLNINYEDSLENQIQGVSLVPLMQQRDDWQLDAFSETDYLLHSFKRSIRTGDGWKFIYSMETGERELYNLNEDPGELNNLIDKEERIAYELEQKLFDWLQSIRSNK